MRLMPIFPRPQRWWRRLAAGAVVVLVPFTAGADVYDEAASDACACLKKPYAEVAKAMTQIKAAQETGDFSSLMKFQGEMMGVLSAGAHCFEGLEKKYPTIAASSQKQDQVNKIMSNRCPNPAAGMLPAPG